MNSVEEKKQIAANINELVDHLVHLIENEDKRFSFEQGVGGEAAKMEVYDKEKNIGYLINIEPIEYDENGNVKNKSL